jgi:hypothetical protein
MGFQVRLIDYRAPALLHRGKYLAPGGLEAVHNLLLKCFDILRGFVQALKEPRPIIAGLRMRARCRA